MEDIDIITAQNIEVDFLIQKYGVDSLKKYVFSLGKKPFLTQKKVIRGISLNIKKGERFGVIGKNGAGKTTLLRVISGIIKPTRGTLNVRGKIAPLLGLGVGLEPQLPGRENIFLCGTLMGLSGSEIRRAYHSIVEFSELGSAIDMEVKRYSSGMISRLGFSISNAVLELNKADILVIDEALSVGDIGFKQKCQEHIEKVCNSGSTVIFVSHSMESIKKMCDRVAFLENGRIRTIGKTDEVIEEYKALFRKSKPTQKLRNLEINPNNGML